MILRYYVIKIVVLLLLLPGSAFSFCFDEAGRSYGISPLLLQGIARVESNLNPAAINRNSNGSVDMGLMQVNSFWLKTLGTTAAELLNDSCYNVMAGAWILKGCIDRHGETWNAVGCYNAASHDKRVNYSWKVYREILKNSGTDLLPGTKESAAGQRSHLRNSGNGSRMAFGNSLQKTVSPVSSMQISVADIN